MATKNSIQVAIKVRPKSKDQQSYWNVVGNSIQPMETQGEPYCFGKWRKTEKI